MQIPSKGIDDDDLWRRSDLRSGSVCSAACPLPQFLQRSLRTPMSSDWLTNCRSARWSALSCTVNPWCSQNAFVQYVFGGSLLYFVVSFSGFFSVGTPPPVCIRRGFVSWNAISSVFSPRSTPPIFSMWARNLRGLRGKHNLFNFLLFFCSTHFLLLYERPKFSKWTENNHRLVMGKGERWQKDRLHTRAGHWTIKDVVWIY